MLDGATTAEAPGNPQDRKLFLERFDPGYAPKTKAEINGNVGVKLTAHISVDPEPATGPAEDPTPGGA